MIKIAHRGNINGPNPERENSPEYILEAIAAEYSVEVDAWLQEDKWYLGHDKPQYEVDLKFINNITFFVHCKNLAALTFLTRSFVWCDYFAHNSDDWVLTNAGSIWTYPGKEVTSSSIIVDFGNEDWDVKYPGVKGVCADYFQK